MDSAFYIDVAGSAGLFILIWAIVGNGVFKPFLALLDEREARTTGDDLKAQDIQSQADNLQFKIDLELKDAALVGIQERDAKVAIAKQEASSILEQASNKAQAELGAARLEIEEVSAGARAELRAEAEVVAGAMLEQVLGSSGGRVVH